jgi:hypothetical protein
MLRWGFWRLLWFGIVAKFGYVAATTCGSTLLSVGTASPIKELWEQGYLVHFAGIVLGSPILIYEKQTRTA